MTLRCREFLMLGFLINACASVQAAPAGSATVGLHSLEVIGGVKDVGEPDGLAWAAAH